MIITERVSSLEGFWVCPLKFDLVKFDGTDPNTMTNTIIGDIVHYAHQDWGMAVLLCHQFFDEIYPKIHGELNNIMKKQTLNIIDLAQEWVQEHKDHRKYFEVKTTMDIWWLIATGTYDCLTINEEQFHHLFDFKTTASMLYYSSWSEKYQIMNYAYMVMIKLWLSKIMVSYELYVKGKNNDKVKKVRMSKMFYLHRKDDDFKGSYMENIEDLVFKLAKNYVAAKKSGFYLPKAYNDEGKPTSACWYCPMATKKKADEAWLPMCPTKIDQSEILFTNSSGW